MNYYNEIKTELINNEIMKRVKDYSKNRSDLNTYYNVGKLLSEAGKHYGEGIIKEYSEKLTADLNKKYSYRSLNYMMKFYELQKMQSVTANLSWGHWIELLSIKNINEMKYYINQAEKLFLTTRELRQRIKNNEYERLDESTNEKLKEKEELKLPDLVKDPIQIRNISGINEISEKVLQKLILEDIPSFLDELGNGFTFVKNEYKIKIGDRYNYIDLLFNYEFNCFVVVELKVTELKKEHIGQIEFYMNFIDKNLKNINQNKTIGIIICKKENKYVIEYCSDDRIIAREYELV